MNYKLEKFWNSSKSLTIEYASSMNYKLEKFWNKLNEFDKMLVCCHEL